MPRFKHLFGPVASRRYGRSLGVDLTPSKSCTLDCVFCQLGPTPQTRVEPAPSAGVRVITGELRAWLHLNHYAADWIALGGSGEPTLHPGFGEVLLWIRRNTECKSLLLSNGTLFTRHEVRVAASAADTVKVSLHAWDQAGFEKISRPHPSLDFAAIVDSWRVFRAMHKGALDLEVFVVPGVNDGENEMAKIAALAKTFSPDRVTLNTAVRPPAEPWVGVCPPERLEKLARLFTPLAEVPMALMLTNSLVAGKPPEKRDMRALKNGILDLLKRHPATVDDVARTSGLTQGQAAALLRKLASEGRVKFSEGHWVAP
ncbi:MAG: radical SAM protein [Kiritimatiellaeota bacterium]|nr:radical SAM protein [Kiritimatiellota bacterium]